MSLCSTCLQALLDRPDELGPTPYLTVRPRKIARYGTPRSRVDRDVGDLRTARGNDLAEESFVLPVLEWRREEKIGTSSGVEQHGRIERHIRAQQRRPEPCRHAVLHIHEIPNFIALDGGRRRIRQVVTGYREEAAHLFQHVGGGFPSHWQIPSGLRHRDINPVRWRNRRGHSRMTAPESPADLGEI